MSKCFQLIRFGLRRDGRVNGLGEDEFETGWLGFDLFDFERNDSSPIKPLDGVSFGTTNRPTTIGAASDQVSVWRKLNRQQTRVEAFAKRIASTLPDAVDLFSRGPHDHTQTKIADENLIFERTKLTAGLVDHETGNRTPHSLVGEHDGVGNQLLDTLAFDFQPGRRVWNDRCFSQFRCKLIPVKADWMAHESTGLQNFQRTRTVPRPLAFGVEHNAMFVGPDTAGTTNPTANWNRFSFGCDLHAPTAKGNPGVIGFRKTKRHPNITLGIRF